MKPAAISVTCSGVSKSFALIDAGNVWKVAFSDLTQLNRFQALQNITFEVPKGEFVGILGRNGAGKSTLLRIIGGVYPSDSGSVDVRGSLSGLYELGLVGNALLTGRQYAERLLTTHGFPRRERARMIADIHDFSELGDRFEDPVQTYSAGMGARLFFATATAGQYEVYLLDEILSVGDQHFQAKCWRRLRERVAHGASGILVTHDWSAVLKLCRTAHVIDRGQIVFSGAAERASRIYLYGEDALPRNQSQIARFGSAPASPIERRVGERLSLSVPVEVFEDREIRAAFVIERMQPGFGWEIAMMTRYPMIIAREPGRHRLDVEVDELPLEPGSYQLSFQLVVEDLEAPGTFVLVDSIGWLSNNGVALEIVGSETSGISLPARWSVTAP